MKPFKVYWLTCALMILLAAGAATATTIVMPTDAQLVAKSPVIVQGTVLRSGPLDRNGAIWTETVIAVDRTLKGDAYGEVTIREIGGQLDNRITRVFGTPEYAAGQRVMAFLTPSRRGDYQTTDLFVGEFREQRTAAGERLWTRNDIAADAVLLDQDFKPIHAKNVQRRADGFEAYVQDRVSGKDGQANYGIENPVLEDDVRKGVRPITANFTLISEPTIYRWFAFDNGGSAKWYSYGTQPGYAGGGTTEVQTAMNVWDSYGSAKINYVYSGTFNSPAGLSTPNGVNEVLFNDPLGEIAGSFNPSTGGVVGQGGFNAVTDGGSWTSPFAADAGHPQQTYHAYNIVEGNLTIQDNVSPQSGISSSTLAEIVAHEFGHTLGLGHSADPSALMYASVSPGGPSLRPDDQVAARWLYPNGSTPPPPPPGPAVPTAMMNVSPATSGIAGQTTFTFADWSTGTITSRSWSFGDGATATGTNVTHVYSGAGQYTAVLTVGNSSGSSQTTRLMTISNPVPVQPSVTASFDVSSAAPRSGDVLRFYDRSSGSPTSWSWSFGDGAGSGAQNPTHAYAAPGAYTVTLTASNGSSSSQSTRTVVVANAIATYRSLVSAAAQTNGVGGSVWRTELTIFNAGNDGANVQLIFIPGGGAAMQSQAVFLSPMQTLTYRNALLDIFGMSSGTGAIAIEATSASSTPNLKVSSRTFTTGGGGTYGQAVPSVTSDALPAQQVLTGMEADGDYRTNLGLVNRTASPVSASLTLYTSDGQSLGSNFVTIGANNFQQTSLASLWPLLNGGAYDRLTMTINSSAANALSAYASVVDNRTQDPVYIQAGALPHNVSSLVLPAVGRAPGANGTYWRSDVTLYNSHGGNADVYLRYLAAGSDNRNAAVRRYTLGAAQTLVIHDVLSDFNLSSGTGALQVFWLDGGDGPAVTSRTYTTVPGGGTYGQSIDPIMAQGYDSVVPGLRSDASFRSNIGLVNTGDSPVGAGIALLSADGQQIGTAFVTLPPKSQMQTSLAGLFPSVNVGFLGSFTIQAHTNDAPTLSAYGSIVDNGSGDPVFFAGQ